MDRENGEFLVDAIIRFNQFYTSKQKDSVAGENRNLKRHYFYCLTLEINRCSVIETITCTLAPCKLTQKIELARQSKYSIIHRGDQ